MIKEILVSGWRRVGRVQRKGVTMEAAKASPDEPDGVR